MDAATQLDVGVLTTARAHEAAEPRIETRDTGTQARHYTPVITPRLEDFVRDWREGSFRCPKCGRTFKSINRQLYHMRSHGAKLPARLARRRDLRQQQKQSAGGYPPLSREPSGLQEVQSQAAGAAAAASAQPDSGMGSSTALVCRHPTPDSIVTSGAATMFPTSTAASSPSSAASAASAATTQSTTSHGSATSDLSESNVAVREAVRGALASALALPAARFHCPVPGCPYHTGGKTLKNKRCLQHHYARKHATGVPQLRCSTPGCSRTFVLRKDLATHEKHCGREHFECGCGVRVKSARSLRRHIAEHGHQHLPRPPPAPRTRLPVLPPGSAAASTLAGATGGRSGTGAGSPSPPPPPSAAAQGVALGRSRASKRKRRHNASAGGGGEGEEAQVHTHHARVGTHAPPLVPPVAMHAGTSTSTSTGTSPPGMGRSVRLLSPRRRSTRAPRVSSRRRKQARAMVDAGTDAMASHAVRTAFASTAAGSPTASSSLSRAAAAGMAPSESAMATLSVPASVAATVSAAAAGHAVGAGVDVATEPMQAMPGAAHAGAPTAVDRGTSPTDLDLLWPYLPYLNAGLEVDDLIASAVGDADVGDDEGVSGGADGDADVLYDEASGGYHWVDSASIAVGTDTGDLELFIGGHTASVGVPTSTVAHSAASDRGVHGQRSLGVRAPAPTRNASTSPGAGPRHGHV